MSLKELQNYTFISRYARYNSEKKRRETWKESVDRVRNMMLEKYPHMMEEINWAYDMMKQKRILGSQRALQFGGKAIIRHNEKIYNCCSSYCDRLRFFQECFFLLLNGCGTGFSVQQHHVAKLPKMSLKSNRDKKEEVFIIPDTIEGWADALGVLISSYFDEKNAIFSEYANCFIKFDFSQIRPKGAPLSSSSGKAPGPEPLKKALQKIQDILDDTANDDNGILKPISCYDIVMHASDAVLSGGVRRSSTICLFSLEDKEMMNAKTGNWFYTNPQRGRSNNSVVLLRDETSKEQFKNIIKSTKECGEPAFFWANDKETLTNPCLTGDTWLYTKNGIFTLEDLYLKGKYNVVTTDNRVLVDGSYDENISGISFKKATQVLLTQKLAEVYEIITSHGYKLKCTINHRFPTKNGPKTLRELVVGDIILLQSDVGGFGGENETYEDGVIIANEVKDKYVPDYIKQKSKDFLRGYLYTITKKSKNKAFLEDIAKLFLNFGTVTRLVNVDNITYELFFSQENEHKHETKIVSINNVGYEDTYCLHQPETQSIIANGLITLQCVEIGLYGYNEHGESGWEMCNLSTINCAKLKTEEDFYESAKAAAIIGTLQAGFNKFPYLGKVTEEIVQKEALLGVSMTGIMEKPEITLNERIQRKGAQIVKQTNKEIAKKIDINQAARTTCVKPEGSTSCILGTSSGIHPHHAKRYIRHVQSNKMEKPYQLFESVNPFACEDSVWSANDSDGVIAFTVEVPDGAKLKNQMSALELLEIVVSTQKNWVLEGTNKELCVKPWLNHNVSNTINVKEYEWDEVADFIYKNKKYLTGVSLLPHTGDKDYAQAPFVTVYLPKEIVNYYGDGALFCSGLIEEALHLFSNDLWAACDVILGNKESAPRHTFFLNKALKFAEKYFESDIRKMTYCFKDVFNWKKFIDLKRNYKEVNYELLFEEEDNTKPLQELACSGKDGCELR